MQSLNINQLVTDGLAPLSYASKHLVYRLVDMNVFEENSIDIVSKSSIVFGDFSQQSLPVDNMYRILLTHSTFPNKSVDMLLRSALTSGTASFRRTLQDLKITHKKVFAEEINQRDKHQNTLLWYLTMAGLYSSIEELYRLATFELDINVKNGLFNQTILHYAVIHGNFEEIRKVLDLGVDTNLCDRFGRTALHYIALDGTKDKNDIEIAKLLVDNGILPNLEDNIGQTSLHLAILKANYDLVEYLISLSNINVCIRNLQGYTPLCYLCEHILDLFDPSLENNQCIDILKHIFKIMNLIIDRCPSDKLSDYFHMIKNNKLGENLLLHVHDKLIDLRISLNTENLFHRLQSIIIGTNQDHRLFVERLLNLHSWKSAIVGLCNTHNVNISNALTEYIAHDPHVLLANNISPSSDLSNLFVLIFYALATNVILLQNVVPMCKYIIKDKQTKFDQSDELCGLCINNYNLHTNYTTFIHTCLHYASSNVFSLKHLCRCSIRHSFQSHIIDKCSYLKLEHRDYLQLNELLLIDSKISDLSSIVYLIKNLYNIHHIDEYEQSSELSVVNVDTSSIDNSSDDTTVQNRSNMLEKEEIQPIRPRTIEEIMAQSDISFHDLSDDHQIESKHLSQSSIKDLNLSFETNPQSIISFSDDEISSEQLENELANMQTKSKNIEEMIDKFLSKT